MTGDYTDIDKLRELRGPEVGHINFGGGMAEKYLGDGRWQVFLEDERHCPRLRHGIAHEAHEYSYVYQCSYADRGLTTGSTYCDGLAERGEPFPSIAAEIVGLRTEVDQLRGDLELSQLNRHEGWNAYHEAKAERDALQAERDTLFRQVYDRGHEADTLMDRALAAESDLAALQARIDALADDWRSLMAIGKTPRDETTDQQWQRWCAELDVLGVHSSLDRMADADVAAWISHRAALGVDPQKETQQ